ncbi:MAG: methyl-accepting chemotaxis protein, partial [Pandoraea sp.]|nr:methyl-accepting chemotaxis protein [Pandoraea sp.]
VNSAVVQMDQVTQQNAALVEQATAATQSMSEQAALLKRAVDVFKVSDGRMPAYLSSPSHHLANASSMRKA